MEQYAEFVIERNQVLHQVSLPEIQVENIVAAVAVDTVDVDIVVAVVMVLFAAAYQYFFEVAAAAAVVNMDVVAAAVAHHHIFAPLAAA
jgi:hypothetical protein